MPNIMELTGTITSAFVDKRKTQYGDRDYGVVEFSDGNKYGTFKNAVSLIAEANKYVGQEATVITVEQNGEFWNYTGVKDGTPRTDINGTVAPRASSVDTGHQEKDARIARQTAGKCAAFLMAGGLTVDQLDEFYEMAEKIENFFTGISATKEWAE